jgi:hypothetical protein
MEQGEEMFVIFGRYLGRPEERLDKAYSVKEAEYLVKEYRMAFGPAWTITYRRV